MKKILFRPSQGQPELWPAILALCLSAGLQAATLNNDTTKNDSTQPRGTPAGGRNGAGQNLSPLIHGFLGPQFRAAAGGSEEYFDYSGNIMANATRDPAFYATLNAANRDFINYVNGLFRSPAAADQALGQALLQRLELDGVLAFNQPPGTLSGEIVATSGLLSADELLPMTGDFCLRCHSPGGWLEGQSEPPHPGSEFLKGSLWGAAFTEYPGHDPLAPGPYYSGTPRQVDILNEAHTGMEGVSCDLCHRATDSFKRTSNHNPNVRLANGNGGFFVARRDPHNFGAIDEERPNEDFLNSSMLCGTCHEVTNPILETDKDFLDGIKATAGVSGMPATMPQPIERTFTEWYWSAFRQEGRECQDCHEPMGFQGAQTWLLFPGLDALWGDVDAVWTQPPFNFTGLSSDRQVAYYTAARENREFMRSAATMQIREVQRVGDTLRLTVRVINNTGHKLPTGFGEGRQMWVQLKAEAGGSQVLYENGALDGNGHFVGGREHVRALYEMRGVVSDHTKSLKRADGASIVDSDEFHFVLFNIIEKDNRIPPRGWNRDAYFKDGAFVVPTDAYAPGQHWSDTTYEIPLGGYRGRVNVTATLQYQTFSREYIDHLLHTDTEPTVVHGGSARKIPDAFAHRQHWSQVLADIWTGAENGKPVKMASARRAVDTN